MKRYVVTIIDIYSRFSYVVVTNSHSSQTVMSILKWSEQMFPFKIKSILTVNGSEFAWNFRKYAEKEWIIHYHTYPNSPKMNANCERYNRTIREWKKLWRIWTMGMMKPFVGKTSSENHLLTCSIFDNINDGWVVVDLSTGKPKVCYNAFIKFKFRLVR